MERRRRRGEEGVLTPLIDSWFPLQRSVLLQLYRSSQEDAEVRVAAYQQLMRCPDPRTLRAVRATLGNESSSQGLAAPQQRDGNTDPYVMKLKHRHF